MTHAFTVWLDRFFSPSRPLARPLPTEPQPIKIEVERLPDYRWRELGFSPPERQGRE